MRRFRWGSINGWRDFLREIAIIVIGVLVALGAGEVADDWNWQRKVAAAEIKLKREAKDNFFYVAEQVSVGPCIDAQLASLSARVLASG